MKNRKQTHNNWETPQYILDYVKKKYGSFFDPCPLNPTFDGLKIPWKKINFVNPPYTLKEKKPFIDKAIVEASLGKTCILLIPSATETKLFNELWKYAQEINFIHKRIKFKGYNTKGEYVTDKTGQSGSVLIILKGLRRSNKPKCDILLFFI